MSFANQVVCKLLESPAHRLMSGSTDVIRYQGRRSGKTFTTPTQYATYGDGLWAILSSHGDAGSRQRVGSARACRCEEPATSPSNHLYKGQRRFLIPLKAAGPLTLVGSRGFAHACSMARGRMAARASAASIAAIVYGIWVRPRLRRWGTTDEEVVGPYPSADLLSEGERAATMAVTIAAPPSQVWPWLVQMGGDRGGWYSWDRLDNGGRPSAREVHPEWQDLALGQYVKYWKRGGPVDAWEVAALDPNRFLGLRGLTDLRGRNVDPQQPRPAAYVEGLWGFQLKELPDGRTRLVIGGYQAIRPRWLGRFVFSWLLVPVVWVMQARMLTVLKRNVERALMPDHAKLASPRNVRCATATLEPAVAEPVRPRPT